MAKASKKSTPAPAPAGKIIDAGARLDAKLSDLKPFIQSEARAAIKRGREARKVLAHLPPSPGGRPKKYAGIIADAEQKIATGAVVPKRGGLTDFVRSYTTSPAAIKTLRNNLGPSWNAALRGAAKRVCPKPR